MITGFKVNKTFWIQVLLVILHSTQQNIIFQHYYQSYCDYLSKMGRMDEEQAVFEQLTLSDFKKCSSTALRTFNNSTIIMTNKSGKIRIVCCFCICRFLWWISCHFQTFPKSWKSLFEHFEGKNSISLACLSCGVFFP